jgi:O-acetylhomoserine/O-acetylserine sulfhydrylase-like pyridoxal-dependent enzyme
VADLARIGQLCRERGILYVVDNTMTTPFLFRPKAVGAGLVVNSLTKSIGGHGIALGGALTDTGLFDWSAYPHIAPNFRKLASAAQGMAQLRAKALRDFGAALGPEAAHHIAVGAETLALRMERTSANAMALATMLEADERVAAVHYPGLASHPQHAIASELFRSYGSLFSFELTDGIDCFDYLNRLKLGIPASNLGDTRTLVIPVAHTIFFEMGLAYVCEHTVAKPKTCDFRSSRIILQQEILPEQMAKLLNEGKTDLLPGFVSQRTRRAFKAFLVRGKDGKISFEFEERKAKAPAKTAAARKAPAKRATATKKAAAGE